MPIKRTSDGMRREYDLSKAVRGKYARQFPRDVVLVELDADVAARFPTAESVNQALRAIAKAMDVALVKQPA